MAPTRKDWQMINCGTGTVDDSMIVLRNESNPRVLKVLTVTERVYGFGEDSAYTWSETEIHYNGEWDYIDRPSSWNADECVSLPVSGSEDRFITYTAAVFHLALYIDDVYLRHGWQIYSIGNHKYRWQ